MQVNDRVSLRSDPTWTGSVTACPSPGKVTIAGDGGWTGTLSTDDVVAVREDKSWPPAGMETK